MSRARRLAGQPQMEKRKTSSILILKLQTTGFIFEKYAAMFSFRNSINSLLRVQVLLFGAPGWTEVMSTEFVNAE